MLMVIWILLAASALISFGYHIGASEERAKAKHDAAVLKQNVIRLLDMLTELAKRAEINAKPAKRTKPVPAASEGRAKMTADDWNHISVLHTKGGNA